MKIRVHFPKTQEGQKRLRERIAEQHVLLIKEYIQKLSIPAEEKYRIWEEVKTEIRKRVEEERS